MGRPWNSTIEVRTPLKRSGWIKRKSPRRLGKETEEEKFHKRAIRAMRVCIFRRYVGAGPCRGPLQAAHLARSGGTGRQHGTQEDTAMACVSHHDQWDGRKKPSVFDALTFDEREAMREDVIHLAREFVAGRRTVSA